MGQFSLTVLGRPAPQGSKNVYRGYAVEASKFIKPWREQIIAACHDKGIAGVKITEPVHIHVDFLIARPKSHYLRNGAVLRDNAPTWVSRKPDIDKLLRGVYDALTIAEVLVDDAIIVSGSQSKVFVDPEGEGAYILIRDADG